MDVGVARSHDDSVVAVKQQKAVQPIGPGLHSEEETQQGGAVGCGRGRHPSASLVEHDVAVREIYCAGDKSAQDERQQHPVLERDVGGKREEIKADVLAVEGIALSVRHLVDEAEDHVPVSGLARGDQDSKDDGDPRDEQTPWEPNGRERRSARAMSRGVSGRSRIPGRRVREAEATLALGEPERQRSVHPKEDGRAHENGEEKDDFGAENRPKDIEISDGRKPDHIDQDVARESERDQAGRDDDTGNRNASPSHVEPPSGFRENRMTR